MHLHTVYFWLHDTLSDDDRRAFEAGVTSLLDVPAVRRGRIGTPIPSPRDVVDDSFDYSLHLYFDTTADHDAYQIHPIHRAFVDDHQAKWGRVIVYDSEIEG